MKLLLCFILVGCANTTITTRDFTMRTQGDIKGFDRKPDGSIHIDDLNHSRATLAGGKAIGGAATAIGTAATGLGTALLVH